MNDSKPPDDNVISFDSFKKKDGQRDSSRNSPPRKKDQNTHFGNSSDYAFKIVPGRIIECKIYSTSEGGYLVKVGENLTAFLSSENDYDFGMILKAQIVCEKDGYLLLSDQMDASNSNKDVHNLFDPKNENPESIFQLKSVENEEEIPSTNGQCIPFKLSKKEKDEPPDEPS